MIRIIHDSDKNCVTIEGHAGSGEPGHDLVCASASILAYTLASFVINAKETGLARNMGVDLKEGDTVISFEPEEEFTFVTKIGFASICAGFAILAHNYPDNVSYEIVGGNNSI